MLGYLDIDPQWILDYRTDSLTMFFKLFPKVFNEYLYLSIIALGYWVNHRKIIFPALGFLMPFSLFINGLLKNLFQIDRPDHDLHLIPINDPFGFPSGDTQIATVFWLVLFLHLSTSKWRYLFLLPLMGIGASRVYLGVHSILDVTVGFFVGTFIVLVFYQKIIGMLGVSQDKPIYKEFFLLVGGVALYVFISQDLEWPPIAMISIGLMMGFIFSLPWIRKTLQKSDQISYAKHMLYFHLPLGLVLLIGIIKFTPVITADQVYFYLTTVLKYTIISLSIFVFIPGLKKRA